MADLIIINKGPLTGVYLLEQPLSPPQTRRIMEMALGAATSLANTRAEELGLTHNAFAVSELRKDMKTLNIVDEEGWAKAVAMVWCDMGQRITI